MLRLEKLALHCSLFLLGKKSARKQQWARVQVEKSGGKEKREVGRFSGSLSVNYWKLHRWRAEIYFFIVVQGLGHIFISASSK